MGGVGVGLADPLLAIHVRGVVGQNHVTVAAGQEGIEDRAEEPAVGGAELSVANPVERAAQLGVGVVKVPRIVMRFQGRYLRGVHARR